MINHVHLGFHFYGAGNVGDDLMLAGFLRFLSQTGRQPRLTCCIQHNIDSQRVRFPIVEWLVYEKDTRVSAIGECDVWLGVGDTPFQSDSGSWFLDHLYEEMEMLETYSKAGYMLCVGVNNRAAIEHPYVGRILKNMHHIWTRDMGSADLLASAGGWMRLMPSADLAHLVFDEPKTSPQFSDENEPLVVVVASENPEQISVEALSEVVLRWPGPVYWFCQEVRDFPSTESFIYKSLSSAAREKAILVKPDYERASLEDLLSVFDKSGVCLTSRYHSAVAAAWHGLRTAVFSRNDKLASVTAQMGLSSVDSLTDADVMLKSLYDARRASPDMLRGLRRTTFAACESFFRIVEA